MELPTQHLFMQVIFRCDPALIDVLPKPQPARTALPDWLRALAPRRHSELHGRDIRTIKQCPPFVDAMAHGFVVLLPCDVHASGDGELAWDWDLPAGRVYYSPRWKEIVGCADHEVGTGPEEWLDRIQQFLSGHPLVQPEQRQSRKVEQSP